jgi:transposase-like protein
MGDTSGDPLLEATMPWNTHTAMSLRRELVLLATQPGANVAELARRYGVSRKTAHKWIARYREGGDEALVDHPRRPRRSPGRTPPEVEAAVLCVRDEHPRWGGRKIRAVLLRDGVEAPSPATVTAVLRRHGRPPSSRPARRARAPAPDDPV